jgi:hypothetical protein
LYELRRVEENGKDQKRRYRPQKKKKNIEDGQGVLWLASPVAENSDGSRP